MIFPTFDLSSLLPAMLYAETHFKFFPFMPSALFQPYPEIIFDLPARVSPGQNIPVLLLANDINLYNIDINKVTIIASQKGRSFEIFDTNTPNQYSIRHPLEKSCTVFLFSIDRNLVSCGELFINCRLTASKNGKSFDVLNDNLITSSKSGFRTFIASEPLPGSLMCAYGDMHVHSQYSQSHVEFGPPVSVIDSMADAYGLSFVSITDHSYDLACKMDNYLEPDPDLSKWKSFCNEMSKPENFKTCMIPGEEITVKNSKGKLVHLCGIGISNFIKGSGDGARKRQKNDPPDLSIQQAVTAITNQGGIAVAAHPGARAGLLQKIFLNRGSWSRNDTHNIHGFQSLNSGFSKSWFNGKRLWTEALLSGKISAIIGGNDAHGDFNRYRCIGVPFLLINESANRYMGQGRTGCYTQNVSAQSVMSCIRNCMTFVTSGPFLSISYVGQEDKCIVGRNPESGLSGDISVSVESSYEFGKPAILRVFTGKLGDKSEKMIVCEKIITNSFTFKKIIKQKACSDISYLRAEAVCVKPDGSTTQAYTSPVVMRNDEL